jgi:hypothetical protein
VSLTVKEAAEAVADLFEANPEMFTQSAYARDSDGVTQTGREFGVNNPQAASWCVVGGLAAAADITVDLARSLLQSEFGPEYYNNLPDGHARAIAMLRKLAESL